MLLLFFNTNPVVALNGSARVAVAANGAPGNISPAGTPIGLLLLLTKTPSTTIHLMSSVALSTVTAKFNPNLSTKVTGHMTAGVKTKFGTPVASTSLPGYVTTSVRARSIPALSMKIAGRTAAKITARKNLGGKAMMSSRTQIESCSIDNMAAAAALQASGVIKTSGRISGSFAVGLAAISASTIKTVSNSLLHVVPLVARLSLSVRKSGGQISAKTALYANTTISSFGKMSVPGVITLLATAFIKQSATVAITTATSLAGTIKTKSIIGHGNFGSNAALEAKTNIVSTAMVVKSGTIALIGRCLIASRSVPGSSARVSLTAATQTVGAIRFNLSKAVLLFSSTRIASNTSSAIASVTALTGATTLAASMKAILRVASPQIQLAGKATIKTASRIVMFIPRRVIVDSFLRRKTSVYDDTDTN